MSNYVPGEFEGTMDAKLWSAVEWVMLRPLGIPHKSQEYRISLKLDFMPGSKRCTVPTGEYYATITLLGRDMCPLIETKLPIGNPLIGGDCLVFTYPEYDHEP